jgi:hypothetical protein
MAVAQLTVPSRCLQRECPVFRLRLHTQLHVIFQESVVNTFFPIRRPKLNTDRLTDYPTNKITDSREQSPFCCWYSHIIQLMLRNSEFHHRLHKSQPATYPEPGPTSPRHFSFLENKYSYYHAVYSSVFKVMSFLLVSPSKQCMHLSFLHTYVTCCVCLTFLDFITRIIVQRHKI